MDSDRKIGKFEDIVNWELLSKIKENPHRFFRILKKVIERPQNPGYKNQDQKVEDPPTKAKTL